MCEWLNVPTAEEKTEWANTWVIFLGMLLDGIKHVIAIPIEKRCKALHLLQNMLTKKKALVKELQSLAGLLNFFNRAIVPGRAFTHRMYSKFAQGSVYGRGKQGSRETKILKHLKPFHHVNLDAEFRADCRVWLQFLSSEINATCHPFMDLSRVLVVKDISFYMDAVKGKSLGFGGVFGQHWIFGQWGESFILDCDPSIAYLELYGLCVGIFAWAKYLRNSRVLLHCDNQLMVRMINATSSNCKNCMVLIRFVTLHCLVMNVRIFTK